MKAKKFAALILALVMALTMLTACGGGGGSMSLSEVNSILSDKGSSVRVISDSELNSAVKTTAASLQKNGVYTSEAAQAQLNELVAEMNEDPLKVPYAFVVSDADLKKGADLSTAGIEGLTGIVDSPEKAVASSVQLMEMVVEATFKNPDGVKYAASAATFEADNGTVYWVISVEMIVNAEDVV